MQRAQRSGRYAPAHRVFFLLATIQAAFAVPLWVAEWGGWLPGVPALHHGHEMLLGYAVAVIGGFLFTRLSWLRLGLAAMAWIAGRVVAIATVGGWTEAIGAMAFPLTLAVLAGLPFLHAARSGHNMVFAPILGAFLLAEALYQAGRSGLIPEGEARGVYLAFDLVALMLLVMGGRILPAAMAGIMRARGEVLADRNLPGLERVGMAGMAVAAAAHMALLPELAALGWLVAGLAGLLRLSRWRPMVALVQPSLWPLHLGYGWLCGGLAAAALATWTGLWPASAAIHAATIGGLGTISATMMMRTVMQRERAPAIFPRAVLAAVALLSLSALARILSPLDPAALVAVSAGAWSMAFLMVASVL